MQAERGAHWPSIFQFLYSGAGLTLYALAAALAALTAAFSQLNQAPGSLENSSGLSGAAGLVLCAALFVPPLVLSFLRIIGKPLPLAASTGGKAGLPAWLNVGLPAAWLISLLAGWLASQRLHGPSAASSLVMAPLFLLAAGLPVLGLLIYAARGLPGGSLQRRWGLFSTGLLFTPGIIISIQLFLGLLGLVGLGVYAASQPEVLSRMELFATRILTAGEDPQALGRVMQSYLNQPGVLAGLMVFFAVFTPLLEELFKTAGVWLAGPRLRTPAEGFAAGALCGAGFALLESLGATSAGAGGWPWLVLARAGTDILHIFNGALLGWALVGAWRQRRWLRLFLTYLAAVLLHGLWNAASLALGILPMLSLRPGRLPMSLADPAAAGTLLLLLAVFMLALLLYFNRRLRLESNLQGGNHPGTPLPTGDPAA